MQKILLSLLGLTLLTCTSKKTAADSALLKTMSGVMDMYNDSLTQKNYGIAGLVRHNGQTAAHAVGMAGNSIPMTPDKVFNIASLTKTFTAVLVLQEAEKGTLHLKDTLGRFFEANPNVPSGITIEQLLRQTSGLAEVVTHEQFKDAVTNPSHEYNTTSLYSKIPAPVGNAGEKYQYCNTNYILLGYLLERINGKTYGQLLQERIFKPCGMANAYAYFSSTIKNSAHPIYKGQDINSKVAQAFYQNFNYASGGISCTLQDLLLFFEALYESNTLINRQSFGLMTDFKDDYGMGLEKLTMETANGKTVLYGHSGDNISFKMRNAYNPVTKDLFIFACNNYDDTYLAKIGNALLKKF